MSRYLVNTSFHITADVKENFIRWVKGEYIPAIKSTGIFTNPMFCRLMVQVEEGTYSYAVHFLTSDLDAATRWQECEGAELRNRFRPDQMLHFTTYMEEIATESDGTDR